MIEDTITQHIPNLLLPLHFAESFFKSSPKDGGGGEKRDKHQLVAFHTLPQLGIEPETRNPGMCPERE